jgi:hypothetical protein
MAKMINKTLVLTYIYLLIYIILSSGVILYNKWVLSPKYFNFPLPITLTMIHMGFSGFVAFLLIRVFKVQRLHFHLSECYICPLVWSMLHARLMLSTPYNR